MCLLSGSRYRWEQVVFLWKNTSFAECGGALYFSAFFLPWEPNAYFMHAARFCFIT